MCWLFLHNHLVSNFAPNSYLSTEKLENVWTYVYLSCLTIRSWINTNRQIWQCVKMYFESNAFKERQSRVLFLWMANKFVLPIWILLQGVISDLFISPLLFGLLVGSLVHWGGDVATTSHHAQCSKCSGLLTRDCVSLTPSRPLNWGFCFDRHWARVETMIKMTSQLRRYMFIIFAS